ncbi:LysR family transcriptional regulator [Caballeronia terrestris]|jgi:DNA-binding transcriptional LysR family regulator|uniref:LysR family transcriptional regulator n=1 Tax=Caballeronia terrestris TaxID=1226301 RepID=A0A158GJT7_9BURK|nr:LysR family transcriptional regulator [Caballeronia terrestris]SAL32203.1 LysR family transcriptional regulator [Caballeronia terrestris]
MDIYLSIEAFVRVAEAESFAKAAQQLGVAKSVITTRVQQLEEHLGVSLFHRSSRAVKLSEVGVSYYSDCYDVIDRMQSISQRSRDTSTAMAGVLRIGVLNGFALEHLPKVIAEFHHSHPRISFDVIANDHVVDPVQEGFDVVLQIFPPASDSLIERRLFPMRGVFVASRDYLDRMPPVAEPNDLRAHAFTCYRYYPWGNRWSFYQGEKRVEVTLAPVLRSNSVHMLLEFARLGLGIAYMPTMVVARDLLSGRLVRVLEDYTTDTPFFSAVYPTSHRSTAKVKLFLDILSTQFPMEPEWDRALGLIETKGERNQRGSAT